MSWGHRSCLWRSDEFKRHNKHWRAVYQMFYLSSYLHKLSIKVTLWILHMPHRLSFYWKNNGYLKENINKQLQNQFTKKGDQWNSIIIHVRLPIKVIIAKIGENIFFFLANRCLDYTIENVSATLRSNKFVSSRLKISLL